MPEGFYTDHNYISIRVIVTANSCEITQWTITGNSLNVKIEGFDTLNASLIVATYENDELSSVETIPVSLKANQITSLTIPYKPDSKIFIWSEDSITPLCSVKTVE